MSDTSNWSVEDHQKELENWILNDEGFYRGLRETTRYLSSDTKGFREIRTYLERLNLLHPDSPFAANIKYLLYPADNINYESIWLCLWDDLTEK